MAKHTPLRKITLKSGRERSVTNRHPWVFSGSAKELPKGASEGEIIAICDNKDVQMGLAWYSPNKTIVGRIFEFGENVRVDEKFWRKKLKAALDYRQNSLYLENTSGYRLVHAEGDGLPGVIIDLYGDAASLQLRRPGTSSILPVILEFLKSELNIWRVFVRYNDESDGEWVLGESGPAEFWEYGLKFTADIESGQKTGFFLDQRDNRLKLVDFAADRTVLNAFSYTGGFSVYALAGEAKHVVSLDVSAPALELAKQHVEMNFEGDTRHEIIQADCFQYLRDMPQDHYDLIILDPPAFTKHQSTVDKATRGYKDINMKAIQKIKSGGLLFTYSCSQHISTDLFRKIVFGAAADVGRSVRIMSMMSQAPDHPINIYHPEGEYLKGLMLYVE